MVVVRWLIKHISGNNAMSCASVNRQTLRIEVESVLHLLFYMLEKEKAKKDVLGGRTFYL